MIRTPEQRKEASELMLHKRGIRLNLMQPVIECDDEVNLRSTTDIAHRLLALWAVGTAASEQNPVPYLEYLTRHALSEALSPQERRFLQAEAPPDIIHTAMEQRHEALYFLAWAAGLISRISIPTQASALRPVLKLFPRLDEAPDRLFAALQPRSKCELLDWSDLLYRLHWAVRHAHMTNRPTPGNLHAPAIREWHRAVNWLCRYDEEDNWDQVSTET